jgi:hypothetical protein
MEDLGRVAEVLELLQVGAQAFLAVALVDLLLEESAVAVAERP